MDTIVVNDKTFVVKECNERCDKCLFHSNKYPSLYCVKTRCAQFIVIREVNVIDKIRMWLKKKIKKV